MAIHTSAIIDSKAQIGNDVEIEAHVCIGPHVQIGDSCHIKAGTIIDGWTTLGSQNTIGPYAVLGTPPQDLKFGGEKSLLTIGSHNTIREFVTINRATSHGGGETCVGDHNFIMAYSHIAHDCQVGSHVILANAATLAGHITVGNHASIGGLTGVHQFVHIGAYAFIGGCSAVSQDIVPFALAAGNHAIISGPNVIGLRRQGFGDEQLSLIKKAFRLLFRSNLNTTQAVQAIESELQKTKEMEMLLDFISKSDRGIAKGRRG